MSYQITITRITEKPVTKRGEHTIIGEQPWTKEDFADDSRYYQDKDAFLASNPTKKVYGYAPNFESTSKEETQVLSQTVEELDLKAVICAINDL